jgi:hypothetical protein
MLESFTPEPFHAIIDQALTEIFGCVNIRRSPSPHDENTIMEDELMLPENRPLDYRISTIDEDEFECDRCHSTSYRLITYSSKPQAQCLDCGWTCPTVDAAIASVGGVA